MIYATYKPRGLSTRSWLKSLKFAHFGHFGTLDPFAEGLILFGPNSKLASYVHDFCPKTYLAKGLLGSSTLTHDNTSAIIQEDHSSYFQSLKNISRQDLEKRFQELFYSSYEQEIPLYSATKYEGKPLYLWVREGVAIKKNPVQRKIYSLKIHEFDFPYIEFEVTSSSGTYVRQLFVDMAKDLLTLGHLVGLKRTKIGSIEVQEKDFWTIPVEEVFSFSRKELSEDQWRQLHYGERSFLQEEFYFLEKDREVKAFVDGYKKKVIFIKS